MVKYQLWRSDEAAAFFFTTIEFLIILVVGHFSPMWSFIYHYMLNKMVFTDFESDKQRQSYGCFMASSWLNGEESNFTFIGSSCQDALLGEAEKWSHFIRNFTMSNVVVEFFDRMKFLFKPGACQLKAGACLIAFVHNVVMSVYVHDCVCPPQNITNLSMHGRGLFNEAHRDRNQSNKAMLVL